MDLFPVEFQLEDIADVEKGWDDSREDLHASVASDSGTNEIIKFVIKPKNSDIELVTGSGNNQIITLENNTVTAEETNFKIIGQAAGSDTVVARTKSDHKVLKILNITCLPPREVHIGIYRIKDSTINSTLSPDDDQLPANLMTNDQRVKDLIDTYKPQANITFVLDKGSRTVDMHEYADTSTGIFDPDGSVSFDGDKPGIPSKFSKVRDAVKKSLEKDHLQLAKMRIYLFKRLKDTANPDTAGVNYQVDSVVSKYDSPVVMRHEVGHALGLSTEKKGKQKSHDEGAWPPELKQLQYTQDPDNTADPVGLMHEKGAGRWIRKADWEAANATAAQY